MTRKLDLSKADLQRIGLYNLTMSIKHKIDFRSIIVTRKKPKTVSYKNDSLSFEPTVIALEERDYEKTVAKIKSGETVNPLELIYLPLYGKTTKTDFERLNATVKLAVEKVSDKKVLQKINTLMVFLNERIRARKLSERC